MNELAKTELKIIAKAGNENLAVVYVAEINGKKIEFVESIQPPIPREKKWVIIISSLFGCPVECKFCDAGGKYTGKLSKEELLAQIDFLVKNRFKSKEPESEKFKIQFARIGEPAFNKNVLEVLKELTNLYENTTIMPSISTIAPFGCDEFFEELINIKNNFYRENFQLQFSIHNTNEEIRNRLIPTSKWSFEQIKDYGTRFYRNGERKITLNFALKDENAIDKNVLTKYFDPEIFLIKITPINPTYKAFDNNLFSTLNTEQLNNGLVKDLKNAGYQVILSVGELEENNIGSNCGQYISNIEQNRKKQTSSYSYKLENL
jgi:23S rRNA (adenine2503-C2)-methyltransferase